MPSAGIVPGFDEVEHGHARLGLIPESFPLDEFSLERREKALTHRVVVGITDRAHRGLDTRFFASESKGDRRVLRALVAVMDDAVRLTLL